MLAAGSTGDKAVLLGKTYPGGYQDPILPADRPSPPHLEGDADTKEEEGDTGQRPDCDIQSGTIIFDNARHGYCDVFMNMSSSWVSNSSPWVR